MSLFRFFAIIIVFGFGFISTNLWAAPYAGKSKSGQTVAVAYTAPDTPDMPSDDPDEPDGVSARRTAPDTPDMPSDDPDEPDGISARRTAPDTPDMPSDDPDEPDGRQRLNFRDSLLNNAATGNVFDKALGWLRSLIDLS